jgi:hypothetical protein
MVFCIFCKFIFVFFSPRASPENVSVISTGPEYHPSDVRDQYCGNLVVRSCLRCMVCFATWCAHFFMSGWASNKSAEQVSALKIRSERPLVTLAPSNGYVYKLENLDTQQFDDQIRGLWQLEHIKIIFKNLPGHLNISKIYLSVYWSKKTKDGTRVM